MANQSPGVATQGLGLLVNIGLAGCSTNEAETIQVEVVLASAPNPGAIAYAIQSNGDWLPIKGASVSDTKISFLLTDNDEVLDRDSGLGVINHQLTVAVEIPPLPVPNRAIWAVLMLSLLLMVVGLRQLAKRSSMSTA